MNMFQTGAHAITDASIASAFSTLGIFWVLNRLFPKIFIAPTACYRISLPIELVTPVEFMTETELQRALALRSGKIWEETQCTSFTCAGLPADAAESIAIGESRNLTVITDCESAIAYSAAQGTSFVVTSGDVLERAAQQGILEQNHAARIYNHEIPNRLSRALKRRSINGRAEILRLQTDPPRQEWAPESLEQTNISMFNGALTEEEAITDVRQGFTDV
jgi:ribosomal protein S20